MIKRIREKKGKTRRREASRDRPGRLGEWMSHRVSEVMKSWSKMMIRLFREA